MSDENYTFGHRAELIEKELKQHEARTDNPHQITAEQIGLGKVENKTDAERAMSDATKEYVDENAVKYFDALQDLDDMGIITFVTKNVAGDILDIKEITLPGGGGKAKAKYDDQGNAFRSYYGSKFVIEVEEGTGESYCCLYSPDGTLLGEKQKITTGSVIENVTYDNYILTFTRKDGTSFTCSIKDVYDKAVASANEYTNKQIEENDIHYVTITDEGDINIDLKKHYSYNISTSASKIANIIINIPDELDPSYIGEVSFYGYIKAPTVNSKIPCKYFEHGIMVKEPELSTNSLTELLFSYNSGFLMCYITNFIME